MAEQYVGIDLHRRRSVIVRMTPMANDCSPGAMPVPAT